MRKAGAYGTTQEETLMSSRISLPLAATLFCAAACVAQNTPLNVKTGEWEATITNETSGQMPIPQEMIDKMTPEQRAKMEAMMKARGMHCCAGSRNWRGPSRPRSDRAVAM